MSAQIFGRDAEQQAIGVFLDAIQQAAAALVLAGSAGSGKTTLLRAGADLARARGYTVLATTPARSDMRLAFAGLADLLEPCLDAVVSELPGPQAQALRVALLIADAPARPPEPRQIATAFRTALTVLARSAPVLVVVDDVQWLDAPSETAVSYAVRRMAAEQVGLICAQRTERPGSDLPLELGQARLQADLLPVGGLSIGALHRLLRVRLGSSFSQPELRRIAMDSGGNPFIALEIGRALARRDPPGLAAAAMPVPETLRGLVDERLAELPARVIDALRLVAVMPDAPAAQYLTAGVTEAELDAAVVAGVLTPDSGRLRFAHPLLGSAVAAAIPPGRLRELHERAAGLTDSTEQRARHRALATTTPSAAVAAELDEAARVASGRGAPTAAAELLELAAALTPADQLAAASRRLADAARNLAMAGTTQAAVRLLERCIAIAPAGPERADALYQLGWLRQDDSGADATALLEQALAEAGDDPAKAADIHLALCDNWRKRGNKAQAHASANQALASAERAGEAAQFASAAGNYVLTQFLGGEGIDEQLLGRAQQIEIEIGSSRLANSYLPSWVSGYCHLVAGNLEDAEAALQRVLAACDAEGLEYWRGDVLLRLSLAAGFRGDLRRAAALAAEGLDSTEQAGQPQTMAALLYACGEAAVHMGHAAAVADIARRGAELARQAGDVPYLLRNSGLLGTLDLALGNYPAAAARLGPLAVQWRQMGAGIATTNGIEPQAVEAHTAVGQLDEAASIIADMARLAHGPLADAIVARCRGELAVGHGDLDAAVTELTEALRLFGLVSPQPLTRARTLMALGGVQRRRKQRAAARATLSEALSLLEGIGAPLWAARARAELARISGRAPGPDDLTATERQVAELVVSGRTNKEVAAELFVSVRAVESTLTKAYAKLGVRSRTELAARLGPAVAAPARRPER
jgi:DNA-binding CsgD family transcriptional regulator